jgi:hypothetical protein
MPNRIASLIVGSWDRAGSTPEPNAMERDRVKLGLSTAVWLAQQHRWDLVWIVADTVDELGGAAIDDALGGDRGWRGGRDRRARSASA